MKVIQTFETTISDIHGRHSVTGLIVPARSIPGSALESSAEDRLGRLGLVKALPVSPSLLPHAIACLVAAGERGDNPLGLYNQLMENPSERSISDRLGIETFQFAEQVSYARLIPFEESPIELTALSTLFTEAGGVGVGAYAGWVIADSMPLLFLTVPAGMVLFGAAAGIAFGLQDALKRRVQTWLSGE